MMRTRGCQEEEISQSKRRAYGRLESETSIAAQMSTVMYAETQTEEFDYLLDSRPIGGGI